MYRIKFIILTLLFLLSLTVLAAVLTPNDPLFDSWDENNPQGNNWGQEAIKLPSAWNFTTGSSAVPIGIVDSGFDDGHEDLTNLDLIDSDKFDVFKTNNRDYDDHGTFMAGLIAAKGNNNIGIAGTMWNASLRIYPYSFPTGEFPEARTSTPLSIATMVYSAVMKGVKVMNLSYGYCLASDPNCPEMNKARIKDLELADNLFRGVVNLVAHRGKDILFVLAAGNNKNDIQTSSPAKVWNEFDNVLSIAAIERSLNLSSFSNYGNIPVAAPGGNGKPDDIEDIFSTLSNNSYDFRSGTSVAAPFVSGLAGLIYSVDPSRYEGKYKGRVLTAKDVKDLIVQGAINGNKFVSGPDGHHIPIINAYESLKILITLPLAPSPWPMYQHDAQHTGRSEYAGPESDTVKWAWNLPNGNSPVSPPVIAGDGTIYLALREGSTHSASLYAVNPDGNFKWKSPTFSISGFCCWSGMISAAIASDNSAIYIGGDSKIYAFNPDGTLKWTFVPESFGFSEGPQITPVEDGTIYVTAGVISWGANEGYVFALNPDGTLKWLYTTGNGDHGWHSPALGKEDSTIYATSRVAWVDYGWLEAISATGTLKWLKYFGTGSSVSSPSIGIIDPFSIGPDGTVYVASDGAVRAFDSTTGDVKYTQPTGAFPQTPAIAPDGSVVVNVNLYQINSFLKVINPDGSEKWRFVFNLNDWLQQPIIDTDGTVYIGVNGQSDSSSLATLYAINSNGTLKWQHAFSQQSSIQSQPAISSDGTFYLIVYDSGSSKLYTFGD